MIEQLTKSEHLWDVFVAGLIDPNQQQVALSLNYHNYTTKESDEIKDATIISDRAWNSRTREQILQELIESQLPHYKVYPKDTATINSIEKSTAITDKFTMSAGVSARRKKRLKASRNCLTVDIYGPNSSTYRGNVLKLELSILHYPSRCPGFQFKIKINHANIDGKGTIYMDMVQWSDDQRGTINECLDKVFELLKNPEEDNISAYSKIGQLYILNRKEYYKCAASV